MIFLLLGVACGAFVSLFGIWCFIRGQKNALQLQNGREPEQIKTPAQAVSDAVQQAKQKDASDKVKNYFDDMLRDIVGGSNDGK